MSGRIANGLEMAVQCFRVLRLDKELIVFPLLSFVAVVAVKASFAWALWETDYVQIYVDCFQDNEEAALEKFYTISRDPIWYALLFCFYLALCFVVTFFNSALVACAIVRFNGGDPNVTVGFRFARTRLGVIFAWSLLHATVIVALQSIASKSNIAARISARLLGTAWEIATYFVVPILVVEKLGPFAALKRSVAVIRRTWGEAIVANIGIGAVVFWLFFMALIPLVVGTFLDVRFAMAIGMAITVFLIILLALISSALQAILVTVHRLVFDFRVG